MKKEDTKDEIIAAKDVGEEDDKIDSEISEIEHRINDLISTFDDEAEFDEKLQKATRTYIETEEIKGKIDKVDIKYDVDEEQEKGIEDNKENVEKDKIKEDIKAENVKEDTEEGDTEKVERKSSFSIYAAGGIFIFLVIAITLFFIRPADKPNKSQPPKTLATHKIHKPSEKIQPKKTIYPEKKDSDQEAGPVGFDNFPPQREVLQEMQTIPKIEAKITAADEINEFLRKWKTALQNTAGKGGDIETYMSFYSDDFISKGLDKNGWRYDKVEKNREKEWIQVELKDINISEPVVNNRAEVSFLEDYKFSNFSVISNKILILKKEKAGWNIIGIKVVGDSDSPLVSPENIDQTVAAPSKLLTYPYIIHISSHRDKKHANRLVTKLRKEGTLAFTSFVNIPRKGDWYRVFISYYGTLEEARNAALKLKSQKAFYAKVVKKPYAIQVGLFDSDQELKKMESDLWVKGYTPYGIPDKRYKGRTRLLIGAFDSKKDAAGQIRKLQNERFTLTVVER